MNTGEKVLYFVVLYFSCSVQTQDFFSAENQTQGLTHAKQALHTELAVPIVPDTTVFLQYFQPIGGLIHGTFRFGGLTEHYYFCEGH